MNAVRHYDCVIIGGGFFGLYLAYFLQERFPKMLVLEKEPDVMQRASYANQARIHSGYHYPRSILTALRSRMSFPKFIAEFQDCVDDSFKKYYAVGKILSKVTARQFALFCDRIGAPCEPAPARIQKLFEKHFVEAIFQTREFAFDAFKLKNFMLNRLREKRIHVQLNSLVTSFSSNVDEGFIVNTITGGRCSKINARRLVNCTYSQINQINRASGLPIIPLKHELTEMALVLVPDEIREVGITVMCGPFFSLMPFPPRPGLHTFSHVRYTPHFEWNDTNKDSFEEAHELFNRAVKKSAWPHMQKDASRYMPILEHCRYVDSLWEVKTVLPLSEVDDSRPILLKANYKRNGYHCVMGGKIDQIYDAIGALGALME